MKFRATVWYASAAGLAVEGEKAFRRFVVERESESESMFKAEITDELSRDVDDEVHFGPVSHKRS